MVRVQPSVRIRYTSPVTVTRWSMVTLPLATYQPPVVLPSQVTVVLSMGVQVSTVFVCSVTMLPSQPRSMYQTESCAARAAVGSSVRHRARTQNRPSIRFFIGILLYKPAGIQTCLRFIPLPR